MGKMFKHKETLAFHVSCEGRVQQSQDLRGWGRRIVSSKTLWATE